MKPNNRKNAAYSEQTAVRKLSVDPAGWRLHLLLPFSLLISLGLFLGLPILLLVLTNQGGLTGPLQTWIRWAGLPASISTLCIYHVGRKHLLRKAASGDQRNS